MTRPVSNEQLSYYEASARQRIHDLVDEHSFKEFLGPEKRQISPHLKLFDLPEEFDDGVVVGEAELEHRKIFIAAQEGRFMGGAIGEVHGAKLLGLIQAAQKHQRDLVLLLDTGGVRLQEANAGEIAIAEIMRAMIETRLAGRKIVVAIGGRAGCYGGGSLIAACASKIIMSEHGRMSVSGPEVIETNKGVEEFDSRDRSLVWRTMGGKHRYLMGDADIFVDDDILQFRRAIVGSLNEKSHLDSSAILSQQNKLSARLHAFGGAPDALQIWSQLGISKPEEIPSLQTEDFKTLADKARKNLPSETYHEKRNESTLSQPLALLFERLFGKQTNIHIDGNRLNGTATLNGRDVRIIGLCNGASVTIDDACASSQAVLDAMQTSPDCCIVVLVDSASQNMSKRDELLGLNQYLAQLAKTLLFAAAKGHPTIGLLYGTSAAGAFIASALATQILIALPTANPAVMDLPSMARVTKLSVEKLQDMAKTTPVFAPGLDNLLQTGGVETVWDNDDALGAKLATLIDGMNSPPYPDLRRQKGLERKGRLKALAISGDIVALAQNT